MKEHADTMGDEPLILSGANTVNISGSKSGGMGGMSALFKKSSTLASQFGDAVLDKISV